MQIVTRHRFSPNKSFVVHEKTNTPRSYLRCKLTGRIFNTVGLRWVPTGKIFTTSATKVDSEPPNGSNEDITNPYTCEQTLNVSAGTSFNPKKERLKVCPPQCVDHLVSEVAALEPAVSTGSPSSTLVDQDAPSPSTSQTPQESPSHVIPSDAKEADHDIEVAHMDNNPYIGIPIPEPGSEESSS
ncbi:hypothetical protein Tco_1055774 [Tanacetum coccineum]|uniref:Uncharacterized protein n=1 Tax=Tanacetum coccineum TaxID=301880 RepID=A0ABQ5H2E2_9ASTR